MKVKHQTRQQTVFFLRRWRTTEALALVLSSLSCDLHVGELGVTVTLRAVWNTRGTHWVTWLLVRHRSLPNTLRRNASEFNLTLIKKSGDISANPPSHAPSNWIILFKYPSGRIALPSLCRSEDSQNDGQAHQPSPDNTISSHLRKIFRFIWFKTLFLSPLRMF